MNRKYSCLVLIGLLAGSLCAPVVLTAGSTGERGSLYGVALDLAKAAASSLLDLSTCWASQLKEQWTFETKQTGRPLHTALEVAVIGGISYGLYKFGQYAWRQWRNPQRRANRKVVVVQVDDVNQAQEGN